MSPAIGSMFTRDRATKPPTCIIQLNLKNSYDKIAISNHDSGIPMGCDWFPTTFLRSCTLILRQLRKLGNQTIDIQTDSDRRFD